MLLVRTGRTGAGSGSYSSDLRRAALTRAAKLSVSDSEAGCRKSASESGGGAAGASE